MSDLYRDLILEHAKHPHNAGMLADADISAEDHNPLCGDKVRIDMRVTDGVISEVRFSGRGCAISQAAASLLTDEVMGMPLEQARQIGKAEMLELVGMPLTHNPTRLKCALLALKVLKTGLYGVGSVPDDDL